MLPFSIKNLRSLLFQQWLPTVADGGYGCPNSVALEEACNLAVAEFAPEWESPKLLLRSQVQLDRNSVQPLRRRLADSFS